jgi:hypothetical protein
MHVRYQRVQPIEIKGDFDHAYWLPANRLDRIVFDQEGNILRGKDLEEYYWKLRKDIGYHPMFGKRFSGEV